MIHLRDMHMTQVLKRHKRHPPLPSLRIHTELQTVETRKLNHFSSLAQGLEIDRSVMEVKHTRYRRAQCKKNTQKFEEKQ